MKNNQWSLSARYVAGIIVFVAVIALLIYAREAVKMLVIAAFVAYLISPAVAMLTQKTKLSRRAAVNIVYFSALIVLVGVPATLTPIFFDEIKIVASDLLDLSRQTSECLPSPCSLATWCFILSSWVESLGQLQESILTPLPEEALALLETTSVNALWFLVILVSVHLFMSEWPSMRDWLIESGAAGISL